MKIDSHQHFWNYDSAQYPWMTDALSRIRHDFLPPDLAPELAGASLDGSIAVQARQSLEETRWLLDLAEQHGLIKGVVGWVDLRSNRVSEQLAQFAGHPKFVGVRHVVQDELDDRFMLQPDFLRGLEALRPFNLVYDLLVYPKQLPAAIEVARRFPEQRFVLDHLAKPLIKDRVISPWASQIAELAQFQNVTCKLSGLITEAQWNQWSPADFQPCLDVVWTAFGEDRVMFGSDWPVCLLSGTYQQVYGLIDHYFSTFPPRIRDKVFGENALRFYRLKL